MPFDNLIVNAAYYLAHHPLICRGGVALTLAAGCYTALAAPSWSRTVTSDTSLVKLLGVVGVAAGACLIATGLFYESLLRGDFGAITFLPLVTVYYAACVTVSFGAIGFAGVQVFCSLHVRPAPLARAVVPGLVGAWLLTLCLPLYQFALILDSAGQA